MHRVEKAFAAVASHDSKPNAKSLTQTRREVLDSLIAQELAAQAGADARLDRQPAVKQAIETARSEVMARAWIEHLSANLALPDAQQITRYYAAHPELFAQRRVYQLEQIVVMAPDTVLNEIRQKVDAGVSLQRITESLQEKQVKYLSAAGVRTPEQIPASVLARLATARDGETLLVAQPDSALVIHIVASIRQPLDEAAAAPRIKKLLARQAWTETLATEMSRLKKKASITYLGEFAMDAAAPPQSHAVPGGNRSAMNKVAWFDREVPQ